MSKGRATWLRRPGHDGHTVVTNVELFFDLVFVFAITQLSHRLLAHLTLTGLAETTLLFCAIWWVWIFTSWVTNWLDPDRTPVRIMLFVLMLGALALAVAIPGAFGDTGPIFAATYVTMQIGRSLFTAWTFAATDPSGRRNFLRLSIWLGVSGIFWIIGALDDGQDRLIWWLVALVIEYAGPALGFRVPGLGASTTQDWQVSGSHMAERCGLFVIIALGEAIVVTGATVAALPASPSTLAAFLASFVGSVAMWWIYFDSGSERGTEAISHSDDPGRIARLAYTYMHMPIVAGIVVVAVADEMMLSHPLGHVSPAFAWTAIGGPALYLCGTMLFKRTIAGRRAPPLSHLVGLGLLALTAISAPALTPILIGSLASGALIVVAMWERFAIRRASPA
jgi:low temperature requirement protein LtrA